MLGAAAALSSGFLSPPNENPIEGLASPPAAGRLNPLPAAEDAILAERLEPPPKENPLAAGAGASADFAAGGCSVLVAPKPKLGPVDAAGAVEDVEGNENEGFESEGAAPVEILSM